MSKLNSDRKLFELALSEDIGTGDITTLALKLSGKRGEAVVWAKAPGTISGTDAFMQVYKAISSVVTFRLFKRNGSSVVPGDKILVIKGPLNAILTGERTAMNLLCHLSGVATMTRELVQAIDGYPARILDTRKTMPGLRRLQKVAVKDGGGSNHRLGLYDMYLIKENHIAAAGGLEEALGMVRAHKNRTRAKIEVEVKDLSELKRALEYKPDYILLDNFDYATLKKGISLARQANPRVVLEASGNINLGNVRKIASTGIDRISIGKMTHSAPALDLSMKIPERPK